MAKNSMKPQIRFKGFTDAWEQRKARDLFDSYADKGHPELPVLSATQDAGMVKRDEIGKSVFHDKSNEVGYKRVLPGQFVIHLRSFQGGFAHSNIEGITSPAYTIFGFKPSEKQYDLFWKYIFSSEEFVRRLETVTYGIRDGRSISYDEFLTMGFIVPSYAEQVKIAQGLIITDNLITLHQRKYEKFVNIKKALLEKMFPQGDEKVPRIRFKGFTDAWEQRKLGECGVFTSNGVDKLSKLDEIPVSLLNYMDVYNRRHITAKTCIELMQVTARLAQIKNNDVRAGDVFFTPTSETAEDIGHSLVIEENLPNTVYSYHLMRYRPHSGVFFKTYPNFGFDTKYLHNQMTVKAKGVQRFVISKPDFEELQIICPSYREQESIASFLTMLDNLITLHQRQVEKLKNIKSALLEKMFV